MKMESNITKTIEAIRVEWEKSPDMRLGQIIQNAVLRDCVDYEVYSHLDIMSNEELVAAIQKLNLNGTSYTRPALRIPVVLAAIRAEWGKAPTLGLAQIIKMALGNDPSSSKLYNIEDDALVQAIQNL